VTAIAILPTLAPARSHLCKALFANLPPAAPGLYACVGAFLMAMGPVARGQNLLTNPSFESGAHVNQGGGFMILTSPATTITGWTVSADQIAWGATPNSDVVIPRDGTFFLDLQGPALDGPFGAVSQTISTVPGRKYHLSFHLGTQQSIANDRGPISVLASAGATSLPFTFNPGGTNTGPQWERFGFEFTAPAASTAITIAGTASAGRAYIGLDLVSVTAVTEPSAAANGSFEDPVLTSAEARDLTTGATIGGVWTVLGTPANPNAMGCDRSVM
jgi:hypothetical protein